MSLLNTDSLLGVFYKTVVSEKSQENTRIALFFNMHSFLWEQFYKKESFGFGKKYKNKLRTKPGFCWKANCRGALFDVTFTWNSNTNLSKVFREYICIKIWLCKGKIFKTFLLFHVLPQWILSCDVLNFRFYTFLRTLISRSFFIVI